ncbi:13838_t:CDS:2 [Cetraspora pellucida]|uniref:13838_t:CDS:1 n=1 Tax=Cetraspora pellucida TaxID=1433469 RepID=A0A9N9J4X7_9GLOM|nr:13838_t:CDS:2 [Cetraspora pellucida]
MKTKLNADSEEEYESLLIFHQHFLDNLNSEDNDNEETLKLDVKSNYKRKQTSTKALQQELPPLSSNFETHIHLKSSHQASVWLLSHLEVGALKAHLQQIDIGTCRTVRKNTSRFPKELKDNGPVTMLSTIYSLVSEEWEIMKER